MVSYRLWSAPFISNIHYSCITFYSALQYIYILILKGNANIKKSQTGRRKQATSTKPNSERRTVSKPRRKSSPKKEEDLYTLPSEDIKKFIEKERRHDELDIINEVREQKNIWYKTISLCVVLNLMFLIFAYIGQN